MTAPCTRPSFTLIELVVVTAILGLAVGLVGFRWGDASETARLRSAARQMAAVVRHAQTSARAEGIPMLLVYTLDRDEIRLHKPHRSAGSWQWDAGAALTMATGARIQRVVVQSIDDDVHRNDRATIRLAADGRYPDHAVVLMLSDRCVVVVLRGNGEAEHVLPATCPQATVFEDLLEELRNAPARTDTH